MEKRGGRWKRCRWFSVRIDAWQQAVSASRDGEAQTGAGVDVLLDDKAEGAAVGQGELGGRAS